MQHLRIDTNFADIHGFMNVALVGAILWTALAVRTFSDILLKESQEKTIYGRIDKKQQMRNRDSIQHIRRFRFAGRDIPWYIEHQTVL